MDWKVITLWVLIVTNWLCMGVNILTMRHLKKSRALVASNLAASEALVQQGLQHLVDIGALDPEQVSIH